MGHYVDIDGALFLVELANCLPPQCWSDAGRQSGDGGANIGIFDRERGKLLAILGHEEPKILVRPG